jgi:CBS domain-containing protein
LNRMPVVDDENRYLGMISRRALKKGSAAVTEVKKEVAPVGKTMTVDEAITLMLKSGQEYIAVIDEESGHFEGLVSFALLQEKLKSYFS